MSGFEVIGVVLGVWPVVVKALTLHKATKDGRGTRLLLNSLRTEEIIYREFVHQLLALDVPEAGRLQLSDKQKPNLDLWKDKALQATLRNRFGDTDSRFVLKTIEEMNDILTTLKGKLEVNDNVATTSNWKFRNINHKLSFSSYKQSLKDLKVHNNQLSRLLTKYTSSKGSAHSGLSVPTPGISLEIHRGISAYANDLYSATCDGYRCKCPFPHFASLGLRQVSPGHINASDPFELLFPIDDSTSIHISELGQKISSSPGEQRDRSLPFRLVSVSESNDDFKDNRLIDDLCTFTKNLGDDLLVPASASSFNILESKEKKFIMKTSTFSSFSSASRTFVCLDDYLPAHQSWNLTRRMRMDLALSLSTAITLLYSTPWIDIWWTWKDFYILDDDKLQIFIISAFYGAHNAPLKPLPQSTNRSEAVMFWSCFGEPILTRLGFALIELALGKRLSELRPAGVDSSSDQDMIDTFTAKSVLENGYILEEAGQVYHDAVQACLSHVVMTHSGLKALDSSHPNFQQDLERFVVAPIRDFHAVSFGQISYSDLDSTIETTRSSIFSELDSTPDSTRSSIELDSNLTLPLESNKYTIEPDWITYEWEVPEVVRLRCRQGENQMSLAETLRTTIVLIGYDFHFEAATCEGYLQREWGNIGVELLDLIICGISDFPKSSSINHYIQNFSVEPNKFSILCYPNLSRPDRNSVLEALDWLCRAIRIPASPGDLSVSLSNQELVPLAVKDSEVNQDVIPVPSEQAVLSHSDLQLSFRLQELSPLPKSQELCWRALFESGIVAMRPSMRKLELINNTFAKGLEVSFELMVQLSAVELPILVDDGIVLVGYQTALVPISGSENSVQWHLEISERGQINPYELKSTKQGWLKLRDWKSFKTMRCFVGWCSSAHINLGTSVLEEKVGWTDSKTQKRTLHWSGISLGCQAATANPMQVGLTMQANFSFVPNKINFAPSNSFAKLLKDTSKEVAAVIDCLDGRSWIVPKLSLMLHMAHAWSARNSIDPDPIPFAKPCHDGSQAEAVLQDSGDLVLLGQGQDMLTLRQLMLGLNVNLLQSRHQTEDAASGKVFGFEFMDIVCEPPMGGNMKRVSVKSPGKCWSSVVNKVDAVVVCANLGQAITPVDEDNQRNPDCNILPLGSGYLAVPLSCLTELILRQGRQDPNLNVNQNETFNITDDHFWKISGSPFDDCTHIGQQTPTCWERENLLQKLTKRGGLNGILNDSKEIHTSMHIHHCGAIVFGEHSVRRTVGRQTPLTRLIPRYLPSKTGQIPT